MNQTACQTTYKESEEGQGFSLVLWTRFAEAADAVRTRFDSGAGETAGGLTSEFSAIRTTKARMMNHFDTQDINTPSPSPMKSEIAILEYNTPVRAV